MSNLIRKSRGCLLVIICLAGCGLSPLVVSAQAQIKSVPYVWKNVKVGAGGFMPGVIFSPIKKNLVYLRSDMGGCYRWEESQKTWVPLNDTMSESSYHGAESLAADPVDPNVVYVAAGMYRSDPAAMLRSQDQGNTWEVYPVPFKMGGNEDGRGLGERLAIDPNNTHVLYFGSRHDGLMRSNDSAKTWNLVPGFPLKGGGKGGLSFVAFGPASGGKGSNSKVIYVGSADPGDHHLFKSEDGGNTWAAVAGGPQSQMLPIQGKLDAGGILYVTYGNGIGPNGVTSGAVFAFNTHTGQWADITPDKNNSSPGGYCGLSIDWQQRGTLAVSTFNHWSPTDTIWRTTDGGKTWHEIAEKSKRDVSASPFLYWGKPEARLGWWIAAVAIDPFDSNHVVYTTGATIFSSNDFSNVSKEEPTHWKPWITGIEQTAIITLISPPAGPHLLSGFGDLGGFAHDDLDQSPPQGMFNHPMVTTTHSIDYAGMQPNIVVRAGQGDEAPFGYSEDFGHTWQPLSLPTPPRPAEGQRRRRGRQVPAVTISADGKKIVLLSSPCMISTDRGQTWNAPAGLAKEARIVVDRVNPRLFFAIDSTSNRFYVSEDGGSSFKVQNAIGLPTVPSSDRGEVHELLKATTAKQGDLWLISSEGLFHSADAGHTFKKSDGNLQVDMLGFGKAAPGQDYPALFAVGTVGNTKAIWRSDDASHTWMRVNDDAHQYGTRFRCIEGDPRLFGRVYFGTDGRGVFYGDAKDKE